MLYQIIGLNTYYTIRRADGLTDLEFELRCKNVLNNETGDLYFRSVDYAERVFRAQKPAAKLIMDPGVWQDYLSTVAKHHSDDQPIKSPQNVVSRNRPYDKWEQRPIIW